MGGPFLFALARPVYFASTEIMCCQRKFIVFFRAKFPRVSHVSINVRDVSILFRCVCDIVTVYF